MNAFLLKLFFSRKSLFPKFVVLLNIGLWFGNILGNPYYGRLSFISFFVMSLLALVLITFAFIPWYGLKYKGLGIDEHFEKIMIPINYLFFMTNLAFSWGLSSSVINIFLSFVFLVMLTIHLTLLSYHLKDKDTLPPAYFAANLYLKKDA